MIRSLARARAERRNEAGRRLMDAGDLDGAIAAYREAVEIEPSLASAWYNLALVHKWRREWPEALRCNKTALAAAPGEPGDPAWWNLGIAATALRDWATAREAWRGYGIDVPDGDGELDMGLGMVPIRVDPHGDAEVVWCTRLDPARARIENIPIGARRWHDVVLTDGEPTGSRTYRGREVPVFDEIEVWSPSDVPTYGVEVVADEAATDDLTELAEAAGYAAQDWTATFRILCEQCSRGPAPPGHDHDPVEDASRRERRVGVAAPADVVGPLLAQWAARHEGVTYGEPVTE